MYVCIYALSPPISPGFVIMKDLICVLGRFVSSKKLSKNFVIYNFESCL